jgi:hypothetical protein
MGRQRQLLLFCTWLCWQRCLKHIASSTGVALDLLLLLAAAAVVIRQCQLLLQLCQ